VNLFLRVLAREESGFHQLETLFVRLEFGDALVLEAGGDSIVLEVDGPRLGPPEENLVHQAARAFLDEAELREGVRIRLEKRIPVQAGLGGGSSDAAATLRGMDRLFPGHLPAEGLVRMASRLGADVPFFLSPTPAALAWGRGDRFLPLSPPPRAPVLLAFPPVGVGTPEAYRLLARHREAHPRRRAGRSFLLSDFRDWSRIAAMAENDFHEVVLPAFPPLEELHRTLMATEPTLALLAGSGGALFAVYGKESEARRALETVRDLLPEGRFLLTRTAGGVESVEGGSDYSPRHAGG
jgi:4-diphosphocytidyl-2-C-methyl-D-erythritol kinase